MSGLNADFTSDAYLNGVLLAEARKKSLSEALLLVDPRSSPHSAIELWVSKAKSVGLGVDMKEYYHPVRRGPVVDIAFTAANPCFESLIELSERRLPENPPPLFLAGVLHALCTVRKAGDVLIFHKANLAGPALDAFGIPYRRGKSQHNLYVDRHEAEGFEVLEAPLHWADELKAEFDHAIMEEVAQDPVSVALEDVPHREAQHAALVASAASELGTFRTWRNRTSEPVAGIDLSPPDSPTACLLPGAPTGTKTQRRAVDYLLGHIDGRNAHPFPELPDILPADIMDCLNELEESLQGAGLARGYRAGMEQVLLCSIGHLDRGAIASLRQTLDAIGLQEYLHRDQHIACQASNWNTVRYSMEAYIGGRAGAIPRYIALWMAFLSPQVFHAPLPTQAPAGQKRTWFEMPGLSQVDHAQLLPALLNPFTGETISRRSQQSTTNSPMREQAPVQPPSRPVKELYNPFASESLPEAKPVEETEAVVPKSISPKKPKASKQDFRSFLQALKASGRFYRNPSRKPTESARPAPTPASRAARKSSASAMASTRPRKRSPKKAKALPKAPKSERKSTARGKKSRPAKKVVRQAAKPTAAKAKPKSPPKSAPSKSPKNVYAKNQISRTRSPF